MPTPMKSAAKKAATPAKTAAKKPAKPAAKPLKTAAAKPAATKSKATKPARTAAKGGNSGISPERRRNYIEVAAYYIAERRGFDGGDPLADWAAAEAEIDRLLEEGRLSP